MRSINLQPSAPNAEVAQRGKVLGLIAVVICIALGIFFYTKITVFVIQPIGAIPEGRTLIIWRAGKLNFIDSADGYCARESGGVSLLCRIAVLGAVAKNDEILVRLPYSETLYQISTSGNTYEK